MCNQQHNLVLEHFQHFPPKLSMCGYPQLTTNLPSISVDFSWTFHINGVRQYEDFASVLWLSIMFLRYWFMLLCASVPGYIYCRSVSWYEDVMFCSSVHHLMDTWIVSTVWLLWMVLLYHLDTSEVYKEFCLLIGCLPDFRELLFSPWLLMSILWGGAWKWYKIPCSWLNFKLNYFCYHELEFMF